ncbi:MAG: hypothetical protein IT204_14055 [Fimbriimonadaceae bacterium]|nr:hypothetical protein [Fimbriimonadaceae bacterium]
MASRDTKPGAALLPGVERRVARRVWPDASCRRDLERAVRLDEPGAPAALAWALGCDEAPDWSRLSDLLGPPADAANDAGLALAAGLAAAAGLTRRRGLSVAARRHFQRAVLWDPTNGVGHLASAVVRLTAADRGGAVEALVSAAAAPRFEIPASPAAAWLAGRPYLGADLGLWWPQEVAGLARFVATAVTRSAERAELRGRDAAGLLAPLGSLSAQILRCAPPRRAELLVAAALLAPWLRARATLLADPAPAAAAAAAVGQWLQTRRELGAGYERAVRRELGAAAGGLAAGAGTALYGWARAQRRWPPPLPLSLALPGRTVAWLGAGLAATSAAALLAPNPVTARLRHRLETRLAAAEQTAVETARAALLTVIDPLLATSA